MPSPGVNQWKSYVKIYVPMIIIIIIVKTFVTNKKWISINKLSKYIVGVGNKKKTIVFFSTSFIFSISSYTSRLNSVTEISILINQTKALTPQLPVA